MLDRRSPELDDGVTAVACKAEPWISMDRRRLGGATKVHLRLLSVLNLSIASHTRDADFESYGGPVRPPRGIESTEGVHGQRHRRSTVGPADLPNGRGLQSGVHHP